MRDFGDVGGILMYKDPDSEDKDVEIMPTSYGTYADNLEEPDDLKTQLEENSSKKELVKGEKISRKEKKRMEKVKKERDAKRRKERRKYKLFVPFNVYMYPFLAWNGPCTFDISLDSQVMKLHYLNVE